MAEGNQQTGDMVPKADLDKVLADAKSLRKRAQEAEAAVKELQGKVLSDDERARFDALIAEHDQREDEAAKQRGEFDKVLEREREKHRKEQAAAHSERDDAIAARDRAMGGYAEAALMGPLTAALAARGITDAADAAFMIQSRHGQRAQAQFDDDGNPAVVITDADGVAVTDGTIETLVDGFLATDRGKRFLPASGTGGSGAHAGEATGSYDLIDNPEHIRQYREKYGSQAYMNELRKQREAAAGTAAAATT